MGTFSDGIREVGTGNFCLQVSNDSASALKPLGFRAEEIRFATGSSERARFDASNGKLKLGDQNDSASSYTGGNIVRLSLVLRMVTTMLFGQ